MISNNEMWFRTSFGYGLRSCLRRSNINTFKKYKKISQVRIWDLEGAKAVLGDSLLFAWYLRKITMYW